MAPNRVGLGHLQTGCDIREQTWPWHVFPSLRTGYMNSFAFMHNKLWKRASESIPVHNAYRASKNPHACPVG